MQRRKKSPRSRLAAYLAYLPADNKTSADASQRQAALERAQQLHSARQSSSELHMTDGSSSTALHPAAPGIGGRPPRAHGSNDGVAAAPLPQLLQQCGGWPGGPSAPGHAGASAAAMYSGGHYTFEAQLAQYAGPQAAPRRQQAHSYVHQPGLTGPPHGWGAPAHTAPFDVETQQGALLGDPLASAQQQACQCPEYWVRVQSARAGDELA